MKRIVIILILTLVVLKSSYVLANNIDTSVFTRINENNIIQSLNFTVSFHIKFEGDVIFENVSNETYYGMFNITSTSRYFNVKVNNITIDNNTVYYNLTVMYNLEPVDDSFIFVPRYNESMNIPDELKKITRSIVSGSQTYYEVVTRLSYFVNKYIVYDENYIPKNVEDILENKRGVCNSYVLLLATMLKYVGIDVRIVNGYALDNEYGGIRLIPHQILLYKDKGGWYPVDPTNMRIPGINTQPNSGKLISLMYPLFIPLFEYSYEAWTPDIIFPHVYTRNNNYNIRVNVDSLNYSIKSSDVIVNRYQGNGVEFICPTNYGIFVKYNGVSSTLVNSSKLIRFIPKGTCVFTSLDKVIIQSPYMINVPHTPVSIEYQPLNNMLFVSSPKIDLTDKSIYLMSMNYYLPGSLVSKNKVKFRSDMFSVDRSILYFDDLQIMVNVINVDIKLLLTFSSRIGSVNYYYFILSVPNTITNEIYNDLLKRYNSVQMLFLRNNNSHSIVMFGLNSPRLIIGKYNVIFEMNDNMTPINIYDITYNPDSVIVGFKVDNFSFPELFNVDIKPNNILTVINGSYVMTDWNVSDNIITVKLPYYVIGTNVIVGLNGGIDISDEINIVRSVNLTSIVVNKIEGNMTKLTLNLIVKLKDGVPLQLIKKLEPDEDIIKSGNELLVKYKLSLPKDYFVNNNVIQIELFNRLFNIKINPEQVNPNSVIVKLINNDLTKNVSVLNVTFTYNNLTDSLFDYSSRDTIIVNGVKYNVIEKDNLGVLNSFVISVPFKNIVNDIKVENKTPKIDFTYTFSDDIYDMYVNIKSPYVRKFLSVSVPFHMRYTNSGFLIRLFVKSIDTVVRIKYFDRDIFISPTLSYDFNFVIDDFDLFNDIIDHNTLYKKFTGVFVKIDSTKPVLFNVEINGVNYTVQNDEYLELPRLNTNIITIRVYDKYSGIMIYKTNIRLVDSKIHLVEHNLLLITLFVVFMIGIYIYRWVVSYQHKIDVVTEYVHRIYPYAQFVKKDGHTLIFIDKETSSVIYVKLSKKEDKIINVEVESVY